MDGLDWKEKLREARERNAGRVLPPYEPKLLDKVDFDFLQHPGKIALGVLGFYVLVIVGVLVARHISNEREKQE